MPAAGTVSRRVLARRERVAELYASGLVQRVIAERLSEHQQTVSRDLAALEAAGELARRRAAQVRREALERARATKERRDSERRNELLEHAGGCGSPSCPDPDCEVPHGHCHFPGCGECAAVAPQMRTARRWVAGYPTLCCSRHVVWLARELASGREQGLLTGRELARQIGVADITSRVRAKVVEPDERGRGRVTWYRPETVRQLRRLEAVRVTRARTGNANASCLRWYDPEWVEKWARDRGWLALRAERHGLSASQVVALVRAEVAERRKLVLPHAAGRKTATMPAAHHLEWLSAFAELRDYYDRRACAGDAPTSAKRICLDVAIDDFARHPERWSYDPERAPREASAKVWKAVKALQTADTEIIRV